jgi:hypothetical protein
MSGTPTLILIAVCGSATLILINQTILSLYHCIFHTFCFGYHFLLTSIVLEMMGRLLLFDSMKQTPRTSRWWVDLVGIVSLVAMNFNLKLNSIGLYHLSQVCIHVILCMIVARHIVQPQSIDVNMLFSLGLLFMGLWLFTFDHEDAAS